VSAPPENIIVVSKGAASEAESKLKLESAQKAVLLDGIKKEGGQPLVVRELVGRVFLTATEPGQYQDPTVMRGTDERSMTVHHAKLLNGALPATGTLDVIVGRRVREASPQLDVGYELHLPGGAGHVSGVFEADGGPLEDEVWTPRAALEM